MKLDFDWVTLYLIILIFLFVIPDHVGRGIARIVKAYHVEMVTP